MNRRALVLLSVVSCVLVGGVAQTYAWRLGVDWFTAVTNSQFGWVLLCFLVSWVLARGAVRAGLMAGGLTGLGLIASYYLVQGLADGWHSASSQFVSSRGIGWVVVCVGGGAVIGVLGALASAASLRRKAVGMVVAAGIVGLGPFTSWLASRGVFETAVGVAVVAYAFVGILLAFTAWRRCGTRAFMYGLAAAALVCGLALAALFMVERAILYPTF